MRQGRILAAYSHHTRSATVSACAIYACRSGHNILGEFGERSHTDSWRYYDLSTTLECAGSKFTRKSIWSERIFLFLRIKPSCFDGTYGTYSIVMPASCGVLQSFF